MIGNVPYLLGGLRLTDAAVRGYGVPDLICDAHACGPGAEDDQPDVAQLLLIDVQTGHNGSERDAPRALHVVIETRDAGPVQVQDPPR